MKTTDFWKNFRLGEELSIAGAFIYNGLRRFYEMRKLDFPDETFEVFYNLSVGMERLLKIAVVLLEHKDDSEQLVFEKSLRTHNHQDLLQRISRHTQVNLGPPHNELLGLLATFYKRYRYDRFSIASVPDSRKERDELCNFFSKHLSVEIADSGPIVGTPNDVRYKKFLRNAVQKICAVVYEIVKTRASELNLYTYELRNGSRAQTVFLGKADIPSENFLWKELLIFFMNTKESSGYLKLLRSIPPLDFDPGLIEDYLDCFQSDAAKAMVVDELEHHYEELNDSGDRLRLVQMIGEPGVHFDDPDEDG